MFVDRPKRLYKYFSPQRWTFFQDLRLRYSPFGVFNDPFEGRPDITAFAGPETQIRNVKNALKGVVDELYPNLSVEDRERIAIEKYQELSASEALTADLNQQISSFFAAQKISMYEKFDSLIGALCLCEERYNLLMWAHYADSHTGFQLEFDSAHVAKTKTGSERPLHRVRYQERRPSGTLEDLSEVEVMLSKSSHWSYEREWRVFARLADAVETKTSTPYSVCLFDVLPQAVTGIVLGARIDPGIEMNIRDALRLNGNLSHVQVYRAEPDQTHYFLNYVPA
ncbi:DUF2971 domain-containing protein [Variovorax sp. PMC12]|uniref:DUF2971 domain-containing protein n=1 Tax=Variovorax sp. PMC12 TaxID=2126319 RepID=UPI000D127946|nr:DUF2971 domain-containing protein [Variovorax sp. PMC12]AVQ83816.1 hypothetical protein C4F17_24265 [Variovorax sp. PMC12]